MTAKANVDQEITVKPLQISEAPNSTKVKRQRHLRRRPAIIDEAITELHVEGHNRYPSGKGRQESAAMYSFGGRIGGERHPKRIDGFVITPDPDASADQV